MRIAKYFFYLLAMALLLQGNIFAQDSLTVTHIANCGFLVEKGGHKIIMDGLFKLGHNHYVTPDSLQQKLLVSNQAPFNDIELICVSHTHEDHFDKQMVVECLLNNPQAKLLCPWQVIEKISEDKKAYGQLKNRIVDCTPTPYTSKEFHINGMDIHACRFAHPGERHKNVQNIAFLFSIEGIKFFHTADIAPLQIGLYSGIKINEQGVDIAFINEDFSKEKHAPATKTFINAKQHIAMHLEEAEIINWADLVAKKPDLYANPYVFKERMGKKVFYFGDDDTN